MLLKKGWFSFVCLHSHIPTTEAVIFLGAVGHGKWRNTAEKHLTPVLGSLIWSQSGQFGSVDPTKGGNCPQLHDSDSLKNKYGNCPHDVFDRHLSRVAKPVIGPAVNVEKVRHRPGSVSVLIPPGDGNVYIRMSSVNVLSATWNGHLLYTNRQIKHGQGGWPVWHPTEGQRSGDRGKTLLYCL